MPSDANEPRPPQRPMSATPPPSGRARAAAHHSPGLTEQPSTAATALPRSSGPAAMSPGAAGARKAGRAVSETFRTLPVPVWCTLLAVAGLILAVAIVACAFRYTVIAVPGVQGTSVANFGFPLPTIKPEIVILDRWRGTVSHF